jgi:hypothetical protein
MAGAARSRLTVSGERLGAHTARGVQTAPPRGHTALSRVLLGRLISGPAVGSALVLVTERLAAEGSS